MFNIIRIYNNFYPNKTNNQKMAQQIQLKNSLVPLTQYINESQIIKKQSLQMSKEFSPKKISIFSYRPSPPASLNNEEPQIDLDIISNNCSNMIEHLSKNNHDQQEKLLKKQKKQVFKFIEIMKQSIQSYKPKNLPIFYALFSPLKEDYQIQKQNIDIIKNIWETLIIITLISLLIFTPIYFIMIDNLFIFILLLTFLLILSIDSIINLYQQYSNKQQHFYFIKQYSQNKQIILLEIIQILTLGFLITLQDNIIINTLIDFIQMILIIYQLKQRFPNILFQYIDNFIIKGLLFMEILHYCTCNIIQFEIDFEQNKIILYFKTIIEFLLHQNQLQNYDNQNQIFTFFISSLLVIIFQYDFLIALILKSFNQIESYKKKQQIQILKGYVSSRNISSNLKYEINKELNLVEQQPKIEDHQNILIQYLKEDQIEKFKQQYLISFLTQFKVLNKFSKSSLSKLCNNMELINIQPNQTFCFNQNNNDLALYLIKSGSLFLQYPSKQKIFKIDKCFGQIGFFTGKSTEIKVISENYSQIYKIKREIFLNIINENPNDKELNQYINDEILFGSNYEMIDLCCFYCSSFQHLIQQCPQIHYSFNKLQLLKTINFQFKQNRIYFSRKIKNKQQRILITLNKNKISLSQFASLAQNNSESSLGDFRDIDYSEAQRRTSNFGVIENLKLIPEELNSHSDPSTPQNKNQEFIITQPVNSYSSNQQGYFVSEESNQTEKKDFKQQFSIKSPSIIINKSDQVVFSSRFSNLNFDQEQDLKNYQRGKSKQLSLNPKNVVVKSNTNFSEFIMFQNLVNNYQSFFKDDMDQGINYKIYYPSNNKDIIIQQIQTIQQQKKKQQIQQKYCIKISN